VQYTAHFGHRCLKQQFEQKFQAAAYANEYTI
jgi:hypothetical protein